ncbi:MAG: hypothetical protein J7621_29245 [Niastella sp.]|nr:hypothetical protein [Niastella sp.]
MQSEQQHIDDFFRKKEEEYQADAGLADANWEQMRGLLQPGPGPAPKGFRWHATRRIVIYIGGFAVVTVITLVTLTTIKSKKKAPVAKTPAPKTMTAPEKKQPAAQPLAANTTKAPAQPVKKAVITTTATAKVKRTPTRVTATPPPPGTVVTTKSSTTKGETPDSNKSLLTHINSPINIGSPSIALPDSKPVEITAGSLSIINSSKDASAKINEFYSQLDKQANVYILDVTQESVISGKEGTRLTIPPFAFAGKKGLLKEGLVTIAFKEYYTYEDILAAKLTTTSGEDQLISDGMVHITAHLNGMPVDLAAGKSIRLEMPTRNFDEQMQLYRGTRSSMKNAFVAKFMDNRMIDTVRFMKREADENGDIDWVAQGQQQKRSDPLTRRIRVMNPYADPYKVEHGRKRTAWYYVAKSCPLTNEELEVKLRQHTNNYFDVIKLKRVDVKPVANYRFQQEKLLNVAGDSVDMTFYQALYKQLLTPEDSARAMEKILQEDARYEQRQELMSRYSFTITGLGWYNCDKLNNRGPRTLFAFKPGEGFEPSTMVSHLVFTKVKTVLKGSYKDNKITFGRVTKDEPVQIVCIGIKDGKVMSCIQELTTDREEIRDLVFTETTPEQFRKKLQSLNLTLP